ncbi:MAG: flagellar assembly protein FliW [Chlamydiales bacterium]
MQLNRFKRHGKVILSFSEGLFGYPEEKVFLLEENQEQYPLLWLRGSRVSFAVVDPFLINRGYSPSIIYPDQIPANDDSWILLGIVNGERGEVNLEAPLLVNWNSKEGYQVLAKL